MRSAADVQLVSAPSWWTVRHLVILLGLCSLFTVAGFIWAMFLRGQIQEQTTQLKRAMVVARARSSILEAVTANQEIQVILQQISAAIQMLLPGTTCVATLHSSSSSDLLKARPELSRGTVYEACLADCENKEIGSITVRAPDPSVLPPEALDVCSAFGELAVLAGRQSTFHHGLLHHSTHDTLTNLPNRRYYETALAEALKCGRDTGHSVAIINIDINKFKQVNDRYGHTVGDHYLQQLSHRFLSCVRSNDTLARVGGDEVRRCSFLRKPKRV